MKMYAIRFNSLLVNAGVEAHDFNLRDGFAVFTDTDGVAVAAYPATIVAAITVCGPMPATKQESLLVSFGKYLLSEKRELLLRQTNDENPSALPYAERFREVYDADLANWRTATDFGRRTI